MLLVGILEGIFGLGVKLEAPDLKSVLSSHEHSSMRFFEPAYVALLTFKQSWIYQHLLRPVERIKTDQVAGGALKARLFLQSVVQVSYHRANLLEVGLLRVIFLAVEALYCFDLPAHHN